MYNATMCGGYCEPDSIAVSVADQRAFLEEKKAILEAKLATLNYLIESLGKEESKDK